MPALVGLGACSAPEPDPEPLPTLDPPAAGEGFQLTLTGVVAEPGQEIWWCSVYPIPIDEIANVQWVRYLQNEGLHHMTVSAPGLGPGDTPYGEYDCNDLYGDSAFMEEAVAIFGGTGTGEDEMHLPTGTVAALPPTLDIIHEIHFVNTTDEPVELYSYLNAYTVEEGAVDKQIYGGSVRDEHIAIPPAAAHEEWSRCVFNRDVEVLFLASHTHDLGRQFRIRSFDGSAVGDELYRNDDLHSPGITQYDPPLVVPAGSGFEWTCRWENPLDIEIGYGLTAADEMCNMAVVFTPFDLSAACEVVETSDGVLWVP